MMEARPGRPPRDVKQLTLDVRRDVDREFLTRDKAFMKRSVDVGICGPATSHSSDLHLHHPGARRPSRHQYPGRFQPPCR